MLMLMMLLKTGVHVDVNIAFGSIHNLFLILNVGLCFFKHLILVIFKTLVLS